MRLRLASLAPLTALLFLQGCIARTAVGVAGNVVEGAVNVTGDVAEGAVNVAGAVVPDGDDEDETAEDDTES
ncbi:MAG: NF038104 family lipoprotein [Pseudomonadota bacterium]